MAIRKSQRCLRVSSFFIKVLMGDILCNFIKRLRCLLEIITSLTKTLQAKWKNGPFSSIATVFYTWVTVGATIHSGSETTQYIK